MSSYSDTIFNALTLFGMIMMILASKGHSYIVPSILFLNYTTQFSLVQIFLLYFESFVKKIIIRDCLKIFLTEKLLSSLFIINTCATYKLCNFVLLSFVICICTCIRQKWHVLQCALLYSHLLDITMYM